MQGYRIDQQDVAACTILSSTQFCMGVFDGHGGNVASTFAARNLLGVMGSLQAISEQVQWKYMRGCLARALVRLDRRFLGDNRDTHAGTTASIVVASAQEDGYDVVVAHLGDSSIFLGHLGSPEITLISPIHRASNLRERRRILKAGGYVLNDRVNGGLSVTRALGARDYKPRTMSRITSTTDSTSPPVDGEDYDDLVTNIAYARDLHVPRDSFLLIVSDGVTDVLTREDIGTVSFAHRGDLDPAAVPAAVVAASLSANSRDNITAAFVAFGVDEIGGRLETAESLPPLATADSDEAAACLSPQNP